MITTKTLLWNMTYGCNLNCSECFQQFDKSKHPSKEVIFKIVDSLNAKFSHFKSKILLKLTGGEVFAIPDFTSCIYPYIVKNAKTFKITIASNLISPLKDYQKIIDESDNLEMFSFSWHHEAQSPKNFSTKVKKLRAYLDHHQRQNVKIKVNAVLIPHTFAQIKELKKELKNIKNIFFHFQYFRVGYFGRNFFNYSREEKKEIKNIVDDFSPLGFNNKRHLQGKLCMAGINYFVINPYGDVFTCHEAYELGINEEHNKEGYLGNILDDSFRIKTKKFFCPYNYCTCPAVVINNVVHMNGD